LDACVEIIKFSQIFLRSANLAIFSDYIFVLIKFEKCGCILYSFIFYNFFPESIFDSSSCKARFMPLQRYTEWIDKKFDRLPVSDVTVIAYLRAIRVRLISCIHYTIDTPRHCERKGTVNRPRAFPQCHDCSLLMHSIYSRRVDVWKTMSVIIERY